MKFAKKILKFALIFFVIGFLLSFLIDQGILSKFFHALGEIPWYIYPLGLIITFYLTLTIHEFGHLFSFLLQGVKIRALYLTIFVFVKEKKKIRFKVYPKLWVLLGGLVIPDLAKIETNEDYDQTVKIFRNALISAPITTISYMGLSILGFMFAMIFMDPSFGLGIIIMHMIYVTLLSILYIYTFKLSTQSLYGDFVAYQKMKDDPMFTFAQISQYTEFSSMESEKEKRFIFDYATNLLKVAPKMTDLFVQHILLYYLEGITKRDYPTDSVVESKIKQINIHSFIRNEQGLFAFHEIILHDYKLKKVEEAYDKFEHVKKINRKKIDHKLITYLNYKTEHQINLCDHQSFLENKHNIYIGDHWIFEPVIDPYQTYLEDTNKLPFIPYLCEVTFEEITE